VGEGVELKISPPPYEIFVKCYPPPIQNFAEKNGIFSEILTFLAKKCNFFQKFFGISQDYHKSGVKFSKMFDPSPP
jgi:hypothetical protein